MPGPAHWLMHHQLIMISVDSCFAFGFVLSTYIYIFLKLLFIEMITPSVPSDQRCETLGHRTTWIKVIIKYLCNVVYYFEMQNGTIIDFIWYKKRNLDPSTVTLRVFENYFKWGRTQVLEIQIQIENIVNFLQLFKKKISINSVQYPELFMNFAP